MNHPQAMPAIEFARTIQNYGYPLRIVPWDHWKSELLHSGERLRENALYPFAEFIRSLEEHQTFMPEMDMSNFLSQLTPDLPVCPDQRQLLKRYFDYFVQVGFLPAPRVLAVT